MKQVLALLRIYGTLILVVLVILFLSEQANNLVGKAISDTLQEEPQKYVYYTDLVIDGVNVGVITTTPTRIDDFLEYSWQVLDEYNFVPKEYTAEQARESLKVKEGSLIIQVDDELYRATPESVEALKKGVEFTKGLFSYEEQSGYEKENLKGKIFSDSQLSEKSQEAINKVLERLEGFEGEANFYVKTSKALERMSEVANARRMIDLEERQELEREVQRLSEETGGGNSDNAPGQNK